MAGLARRLRTLRRAADTARTFAALDDDEIHALVQLARWLAEDHVRPRRAARVHPDAWVSPLASIRFGARVEIGSKAAVGPFASVWGGFESAFVRIGDEAQIGPGALIVAGNHRIDGAGPVRQLGFDEADVTIGAGAWVGANAVVIGCSVGEGAVIGAGAVVTSDIPARAVAHGAPARVARMRGDR
jgi:acetyltransferase-like isoleucine patch superfamily enzyme